MNTTRNSYPFFSFICGNLQNLRTLAGKPILLTLTQPVVNDEPARHHTGAIPGIVWAVLVLQISAAAFLLYRAYRIIRPRRPKNPPPVKPEA